MYMRSRETRIAFIGKNDVYLYVRGNSWAAQRFDKVKKKRLDNF